MKPMIAYCGLDCETCDAYVATVTNDDTLREKTAKLWSELNQTTILPEWINCEGCRTDGIKTVFCEQQCEIRKCAAEKQMDTCGDCEKLHSCQTLAAITAHTPQALENLRGE